MLGSGTDTLTLSTLFGRGIRPMGACSLGYPGDGQGCDRPRFRGARVTRYSFCRDVSIWKCGKLSDKNP
jgi:hypothetical protein